MKRMFMVGALYISNVPADKYYQGEGKWGYSENARKHLLTDEAVKSLEEASEHLPDGADELVIVQCTEG